MCNLMHNGIKCNDVYLQRCFNHLLLLTFIEKVKICEINIISCGCPKNNKERYNKEDSLKYSNFNLYI